MVKPASRSAIREFIALFLGISASYQDNDAIPMEKLEWACASPLKAVSSWRQLLETLILIKKPRDAELQKFGSGEKS